MEERELRSRVNWIVGLLLSTAFVGTIVYSVVQDSDDDRDDRSSEAVHFEEVGAPIDPNTAYPLELPATTAVREMAELTVHTDGCGVIRPELPAEYDLTWVIKDEDGFQVLGRNANGETRYRYFRPGTYTVVLESAGAEISNTVTINC